MGWNTDYRDLIAPHYEELKRLFESGPNKNNDKQVAFVEAVRNKTPSRPLEVAWVELHALSETQQQVIIRGFSQKDRTRQLIDSKAAFAKLLAASANDAPIDYEAEMRAQGIDAPKFSIDDPLGSREEFLRDRARNKYNGR